MAVNKIRRNGSYAPLSAHYYKDDAIDEAGEAAELLYVRGLAFCADVLSDGFISDRQLVRFVGVGMSDVVDRAKVLVEVRLWEREDGGYRVRSWLEWNRSKDEITDYQARDAARKRGAAESGRRDPEPPDGPSDGGLKPSERNPRGVHAERRTESEAPSERPSERSPAGLQPRARTPRNSTPRNSKPLQRAGEHAAGQAGATPTPSDGSIDEQPNNDDPSDPLAEWNRRADALEPEPAHPPDDYVPPVPERHPALAVVIDVLAARTGTTVDLAHAHAVAKQLLAGRQTGNAAAYLRACLERDPAPDRFLPTPIPPAYQRTPA